MPSITPLQKAAFDGLDALHVGQLMLHYISRKPISEWYSPIIDQINKILQKEEITGKQAEITKHYILATLEIYLFTDKTCLPDIAEYFDEGDGDETPNDNKINEQLTEYNMKFTLAMLLAIAHENGVDKDFILQVAEDLMNDKVLALSTMPVFLLYQLTERCYAFEYPDAPLGFYHELVSCEIIKCKKYSRKIDKYTKESNSELSLLFIRAGLIFEFKMLQRSLDIMKYRKDNMTIILPKINSSMSNTNRKIIANFYKRFIDAYILEERLDTCWVFQCKEHVSKANAERLFKIMSKFYFQERIFGGTQGRWLGTLGAFDIKHYHREKPELAIYYEANNSHTISEKVKSKFSDYGFSVSARSLYLRHKEIREDIYPIIKKYYRDLQKIGNTNL